MASGDGAHKGEAPGTQAMPTKEYALSDFSIWYPLQCLLLRPLAPPLTLSPCSFPPPSHQVFIRFLDMVTIAVPPALPACLAIATVLSIGRLRRRDVFVTSPERVAMAGQLDVICFDKTGGHVCVWERGGEGTYIQVHCYTRPAAALDAPPPPPPPPLQARSLRLAWTFRALSRSRSSPTPCRPPLPLAALPSQPAAAPRPPAPPSSRCRRVWGTCPATCSCFWPLATGWRAWRRRRGKHWHRLRRAVQQAVQQAVRRAVSSATLLTRSCSRRPGGSSWTTRGMGTVMKEEKATAWESSDVIRQRLGGAEEGSGQLLAPGHIPMVQKT